MPYVPGLLSAINPIHQFELDGKKSGMLYASKEISFRLNRLAESINGVISELAETCFIVLLFNWFKACKSVRFPWSRVNVWEVRFCNICFERFSKVMIPPSLVSGSVKMSFFPVGMVVTSGRVLAATLSSGNDIVSPFWHVPYASVLKQRAFPLRVRAPMLTVNSCCL